MESVATKRPRSDDLVEVSDAVTLPSSIFLQLLEKAEQLAVYKSRVEQLENDAKSYDLALQSAEEKVASLRERLRERPRVPRGTPVAESAQAARSS